MELYYQITLDPVSDACEVVIYIKDFTYDNNFIESNILTSLARTNFQFVKPYADDDAQVANNAIDTTVNDLRPEVP